MATILWIDDDYEILSGLGAYLAEIVNLDLLTAKSVAEAREILHSSPVDLLLFDMVLMDDQTHASLGRGSGIHLATEAIERGIFKFVAYTVLTHREVQDSWDDIIKPTHGNTIKFQYFDKGRVSVRDVVAGVRQLLNFGGV